MFSQNSVPRFTHQRRRGRRSRGLSRRRTSVIQRSGQLSLVQEVVQLWQEVPVGWLRAAPTHHVGQTVALSVLGGASERHQGPAVQRISKSRQFPKTLTWRSSINSTATLNTFQRTQYVRGAMSSTQVTVAGRASKQGVS